MPIKIIFVLTLVGWFGLCSAQEGFNKPAFYSVMMHDNLKEIDQELNKLSNTKDNGAYKGALLMKKSGLLPQAKDKLNMFKEGKKNLETAINKDSANIEFRFLRLLIQENAPKIVNYNSEIKKDASYLRANYKNLSADTQKLIFNYSKKSKELKPEDFKNELHD